MPRLEKSSHEKECPVFVPYAYLTSNHSIRSGNEWRSGCGNCKKQGASKASKNELNRSKRPSAWNVELGAAIIDSIELAVRYGGSDDGGAEWLPESH
jgi:hypothetical protein